jgi:hypothetical protein
MKRPFLAFFLSFILLGAGMWCLGIWAWGFAYLGVVRAIGLLVALTLSEEAFAQYCRIIAIACGGGSGGLAMALARQMNEKIRNEDGSPHSESGMT